MKILSLLLLLVTAVFALDFESWLEGLKNEAREKLRKLRPADLGQASRIKCVCFFSVFLAFTGGVYLT